MPQLYPYAWELFVALNGNKFEPKLMYEVINANIPGLQNIMPSSTTVTFQFADAINADHKVLLDSYVAQHQGTLIDEDTDFVKDSKGAILMSVTKPEGKKVNVITHNFVDPRTWYQKAVKYPGVTLAHVTGQPTDHTVYEGTGQAAGVWIDNAHGRYTKERTATTDEGHIPRLKVYVNGEEKTERAFGAVSGGDYQVDYTNHKVTFFNALQPGDTVTADVFVAGSSEFAIRPLNGASVDIDEVEVQYGISISMRDAIIFEPYMTNPETPEGPKIAIPGQSIVYNTKMDFVNECNGSYPLVKKATSANPSERDMPEDMQIFKWDYKTETKVSDKVAPGFEIRVFLEQDIPFIGDHDRSAVVATFYCRVMS